MPQTTNHALHSAARIGDVARIIALLDGENRVGEVDEQDMTALDHAIAHGHVDAARVLLERGASAFRIGRDGVPPLARAEALGHAAIADLLRLHGAGRSGPVSQWFKLDRNVMSVAKLDDPSDDLAFWRSRSPQERLQGLEYLRQMNYGPLATARLQRVLEVVDRSRR